MTDIRSRHAPDTLAADYALEAGTLATDAGLETAVIIALFTDARANPDDVLPGGPDAPRRGWWGDAVPPTVGGIAIEGNRIGSRLWLLAREKQLTSVLERARTYAREALQWLIDDGIAEGVTVEAESIRPGVLALQITITRPRGQTSGLSAGADSLLSAGADSVYRFAHVWDIQAPVEVP